VERPLHSVSSLVALLRERAGSHELSGYTFLGDGETETDWLSYGVLDQRARAIAASLQKTVSPQERAVLLFPPGLDFIAAFFGCLYSDIIAVPAYPPNFRKDNPRLRSILLDATPQVILAPAAMVARADGVLKDLPPVRWLPLPEGTGGADNWRDPNAAPETVAFLQYTSGSTGDPKGVVVTHGNLLHNQQLIQQVFGQTEDSIVLGWLPLYHDMGLIGNVLQPLWVGGRCILMPPVSFLQRPRRWLEAITRYRATTSGGPNFGYEMCVRKIPPERRESLDLSSWEVAFNGAEPVRSETLERFAAAFRGQGFRRSAFCPCYGLAEATLLVAGVGHGEEPSVRTVDAASLARHRVASAETGAPAVELAGSGSLCPGQRLAVVDPETLVPCARGQVGEIWIQSPSVARGYWNRPEETARTFGAHLPATGEGPLLRTGDLGFLAGGELFVTGRIKDLIILRGRNLYPQDVEATVERSHSALRAGCAAAFSIDAGGEERLVVACEIDRRAPREAEEIEASVRRAVAEEQEALVYALVLLAAGGIPKTTSGKIRRHECRQRFLAGSLGGVVLWSRSLPPAEETTDPPTGRSEGDGNGTVHRLRELAARVLGIPSEKIDPRRPLVEMGLDSLAAIELAHAMEPVLGTAPSLAGLLAGASLEELAATETCEREPVALSLEGATCGEHSLSYGQRALWFLERLAPGNGAYNLGGAARTRGLDRAALEHAVQSVVDRHPALRTTFGDQRGEPLQRVGESGTAGFGWLSAAGWSEQELEERLAEERDSPFDLERGPLLRLAVFSLSPAEQIVTLTVHHLVADFWSLGVIIGELGAFYRQEAGGRKADLEPLPLRATDVARWEKQWLASPAGQRGLAAWLAMLGTDVPVLDLPTDRPRPPVQSFRGTSCSQWIGDGARAALAAQAQARRGTLFFGLLAAFATLLHRLTRQEQILIGSPVAGRGTAALSGVVGYFANPLVLRVDFTGNPSFLELLDRVRNVALSAFAHSEVPFPLIAERLQPERDSGRPPIFQAMLVLHKARHPEEQALAACALGQGGARLGFGGLVLESLPRRSRHAQLDLAISLAEMEGGLAVCLEAAAALFDGPTAGRMSAHFATLLRAAVNNPAQPAALLPLLAPQERQQLLMEWNDTETASARDDLCLHELFEAQVERTPEATALVHGRRRLSYRELDAWSDRLARRLSALGVGPEARVAVLAERSPQMVVALLAILKAGGCYVPLDPAYPGTRLAFMLEDSGALLLLTEKDLASGAPPFAGRVELLGEEQLERGAGRLPRTAGSRNLAYLIYTSGSTGHPKAVAIEHRSPVMLVRWAREAFSREELAGVLAATSICFDLSVFELFVPLACGGIVVLAPNVLELPRLLAAGEVTLVNTVPSLLAELMREGGIPSTVRTVNLAGEPLPGPLVQRIGELGTVRRVLNLYGPSEDTTYSTWAPARDGEQAPTIGRPLMWTRAYVLDGQLEPVPIGVPGEILLGGDGLARGYLGRPELTAERFVPDPWAGTPGARLYRTGDLARVLPDGELAYLGRRDHQVKVRGFRVELGEVEAALTAHPGVHDAAVTVRPSSAGHAALVAWVVPVDPARRTDLSSMLRRYLREHLPTAMIPAAFLLLEALPRTPSGKLDRRNLPDPTAAIGAGDAAAEPSRTMTEELVAGIWAELLGCERIGSRDSFFDLGGHSLLAMQVVSRVYEIFRVDLTVGTLFEEPTLAGFAGRIETIRSGGEAAELAAREPMPTVPRHGEIPLSFAQERLWFLHQLDPESSFYNIPIGVRLSGRLDPVALSRALAQVVGRHESLRTRFFSVEGRPAQEIAPRGAPDLPGVDLSGLPKTVREREMLRLARSESRQSFDLGRAPLLRARLLRLGAEEHALLLTLHHLVADGWSLGVLVREVSALYTASPLPELTVQYADFAQWQRAWMAGGALERQLQVWKARLAGAPPLELPVDRPRPAVQSHRGARCSVALPAGLDAALAALARRCRATRFMVLLAVFQMLLSRMCGQEDIVVGSPVAGRSRRETEGLIGLFVNTVALRTHVAAEEAFEDLLARVQGICLEAYTHQDLPFEKLVEELQPERSLSRSPLFQVLLALQGDPEPLEIPGVRAELVAVGSGTAKFDLTLTLTGPSGSLEYAADLFDSTTAARMAEQWQLLLEAVVADPRRPVGALPLLGEAVRHQLMVEWNDTRSGDLHARTFHELFAEQARRTPDALAVVAEPQSLTYRELEQRANCLAHRLLAMGACSSQLVALYLERSVDFVVGILASHKAGAAYLPLDPGFPVERTASILAEAEPAVLVTRTPLLAGLRGWRNVALSLDSEGAAIQALPQAPPAALVAPEMLAYVIYTSGSTGRPKGVAVEHRHLLSYVRGLLDRLRPPTGASWAVVSTLAADLGHTCVFPALATGGCLHLVSRECAADPAAFAAYCRRHPIDCLKIVPSHLAELEAAVGETVLPRLRLILGGEACDRGFAERLHAMVPAGCVVFNHYGPTETTVGATAGVLDGPDRSAGTTVPLGRPLADTRAYVLGLDLRPVPIGVHGELLLGGDHVVRGYVGSPGLTAERFIPDPFGICGERLYRTGDRARILPDGRLEFLGRMDRQVKIRGFRIEPQEIEAALLTHPEIRAAVVEVREDGRGERRLMAWVVRTGSSSPHELQAFLKHRLPDPMVPDAFIDLEALPLTANGKIDRKALPPAPDVAAPENGAAPRHEIEALLVELWAEALGRDRVGIHDDFFRLGGHSLLAMRLVSRIRAAFDLELPLRLLFEAPSAAAMAEQIAKVSAEHHGLRLAPITATTCEGDAPLSFAQQRLWFLDQLEPGTPAYNLSYHARFAGPLRPRALELALGEVTRRHAILRTTFPVLPEGPVQRIAPPALFSLPQVDLSGLPAAVGKGEEKRLSAAAARQSFNLSAGPLLRCVLVRWSAEDHLLLLDLHHIVCDAWSRDLLVGEVAAAYEAFTAGLPSPLGDLSLQYADFSRWQREALEGEALEHQLRHWRERLHGALPVLRLPTDRPPPRRQSSAGGVCTRPFAPTLARAAERIARQYGATPFMLWLTAFQTLLYRYSDQPCVIVGTPIANRSRSELEPLIGFFVNTLPIRADLAGEMSFTSLLDQVRRTALAAYSHQDLPFERLIEEIQVDRRARTPLFQTLFLLQSPVPPRAFAGLELIPFAAHSGTAKLDLTLAMLNDDNGLTASVEYSADLFDRATAGRLLGHFETMLSGIAADPGQPIEDLPLLSPAERHQILVEWNPPTVQAGRRCLHELFIEQAARHPDATALIDGDREISYGELRTWSGLLARRLRTLGVGPEVPVGVLLERSWHLVAILLGVLEAGGAYVGLDPSSPRERLELLLADSKARLLLTQESFRSLLPAELVNVQIICREHLWPGLADGAATPPALAAEPESLAYLIYTSGSTGRPKAVAIEHRSAVALVEWSRQVFADRELQGVLASTTICFDLSVFELFVPLGRGGTVVLAANPLSLPQLLAAERVRLINTVPSALAELVRAGGVPAGVETVNLAGEPLNSTLVAEIHRLPAPPRVLNLYGPSEDTTYSTWAEVPAGSTVVSIGRPISGTCTHVLDRAGRELPIGVPGELILAGTGLARAYLGRPELTAERFVPDPFSSEPGARAYRTGDLVRRRPDGELEFLGRIDHQVKVRGFRIEPGEIEGVLEQHSEVREAVVVAQGEGAFRHLVAYVAGEAEAGSLRSFLRDRLPEYLVPSLFVQLEALPRTSNGKIDRRALPSPESSCLARGIGSVPPSTPVEIELARIWTEVLRRDALGIHDNFFELGGHSLLATRLVSRCREIFTVELLLRQLFDAPTIAELSLLIESQREQHPVSPPPAIPRAPRDRYRLGSSIEPTKVLRRS
jgi:amino acid adenylation domain-containing protein